MSSLVRRLVPALCAASLALACHPVTPPPRSPSTSASAAPSATSTTAAAPSRTQRRALKTRAFAAYERRDFAACAGLFEQAGDRYGAACCHAQAGARDAAFAALARAIEGGERVSDLDKDSDLEPLHSDPRWQRELDHLVAWNAAHHRTLNPELTRLFHDDQADRQGSYESIDWTQVTPRDQARRKRVDEIVAAGGALVADDYYHAAMVYQHGNSPDEIQRAHDLAMKAVDLDPGLDSARWLAAASEDRKLMYENRPQKWGTQSHKVDGKWVLWPVDPAITDEQRDAWNVPPLAEAEAQVARLNATR